MSAIDSFHKDEIESIGAALQQSRLTVYVLAVSLLKLVPGYFPKHTLDVMADQEKEILKMLNVLQEGTTVNDLVMAVFMKGRMH